MGRPLVSDITKTERNELRRVVRAQFKVLRSEVDQRAAELHVELDDEIRDRFADEDKRWDDLKWQIAELAREANRAANDLVRQADMRGVEIPDGHDYEIIMDRRMARPTGDRERIRKDGRTRINAQVRAAKLQLERQEADLLRELAADAIESEDAQRFLASIPTIGELVPSTRLAEIEAGLS
jgi:ElaB/YqjD/DUF883 family membrane-anchored ribosome-binding protein